MSTFQSILSNAFAWHRAKIPNHDIVGVVSENSQAYSKFLNALAQHRDASINIAFHGTDMKAVDSIMSKGFDVKRRKRQKYGFGEYVSLDVEVAKNYASENDIIVCVMLYVPQVCEYVSEIEGFVVKTPSNGIAFLLPIFHIRAK